MASDQGHIPLYNNQGSTDRNWRYGFQILFTDFLVLCQNIDLLLRFSRRFLNFRWANALRDHSFHGRKIRDIFFQVYGRATAKYKYHPLQRWENAVRRFNVNESLMHEMEEAGNKAFYERVCGRQDSSEIRSFKPDFSLISSYSTIFKSGEFVYEEAIRSGKNEEDARFAKDSYMRGFSRVIDVHNFEDWEKFREELRDPKHEGNKKNPSHYENVLPIALSYKGKERKTIRKMTLMDGVEDGNTESNRKYEEEEHLTTDFVDDFRWPQLIRSCIEIANEKRVSRVSIWIDRLVKYCYTDQEKKTFHKRLD